jgi:hypothetical protein
MQQSRPNSATQVPSMGETPAEARRRMTSGGGTAETTSPFGEEIKGPLQPQHLAAIEEAEGGFSGGPVDGGTVEDAPDEIEPPTPSKAMETIRQLSQDKLQLQTELDAALAKVGRYEAKYEEVD